MSNLKSVKSGKDGDSVERPLRGMVQSLAKDVKEIKLAVVPAASTHVRLFPAILVVGLCLLSGGASALVVWYSQPKPLTLCEQINDRGYIAIDVAQNPILKNLGLDRDNDGLACER